MWQHTPGLKHAAQYSGVGGAVLRSTGLRNLPGTAVLGLPALLYAFLPRPPVAGAQFLVYPAMASILFVLSMVFLRQRRELPKEIVILVALLLLLNASTAVSFFLNTPELRIGALAELLRPALFVTYLIFGYLAAWSYGDRSVNEGLLLAAKVILLGQAVIGVTQLAGVPVFEFIYSGEKARPFGSLVRVTGSMSNPNSFGWVVAQSSVIIMFLGRRRLPWLSLAAFLMLVSGSRTLLLLFPFMLTLVTIWRRGSGLTNYARGAAIALAASGASLVLVLSLAAYLPYLGEMRSVILSGSLASINSLVRRLDMWQAAYHEFHTGGLRTWTLGLGSRQLTRVIDNDYLYILFRLGAIGWLIHGSILLYMARLLIRAGNPAGLVGLQYMVFCLVLGLVFETLGGWNFPLLLFFYTGAAVGLAGRHTWAYAGPDEARVRPIAANSRE